MQWRVELCTNLAGLLGHIKSLLFLNLDRIIKTATGKDLPIQRCTSNFHQVATGVIRVNEHRNAAALGEFPDWYLDKFGIGSSVKVMARCEAQLVHTLAA
jgi:hypothetical protein